MLIGSLFHLGVGFLRRRNVYKLVWKPCQRAFQENARCQSVEKVKFKPDRTGANIFHESRSGSAHTKERKGEIIMTEPEKMKIMREKKLLIGTGKKVSNVTASKKKKAALKALADLEAPPEIYATFKQIENIICQMSGGDSACNGMARKLYEHSMKTARKIVTKAISEPTTLEEIIECYDSLCIANELTETTNIMRSEVVRICLQKIKTILKG